MSQHPPAWSAEEDLALLIAVCRANECFTKGTHAKWDGVEEYLQNKGHDRTTIAIRARFNRSIKRRINSKAPQHAGTSQVPCKTLGAQPLLFSIPACLLDDVGPAAELQVPVLDPGTFGSLEIKPVRLSAGAGPARYHDYDDHDDHGEVVPLPTRVGAVALDGSYRAFLVNRDALRGAAELSYTMPSAAAGDSGGGISGGCFGVSFPDAARPSPPARQPDPSPGPGLLPYPSPFAHPFADPPCLALPQHRPQTPTQSPRQVARDPFSTPRGPGSRPWFAGAERGESGGGDPGYPYWLQPPLDSPFHLSPGLFGGSPTPRGVADDYLDPEMSLFSCTPDGSPKKCSDKED